MSKEKVIIKIRKLLELSENNPNDSEAMSAMFKAQELLAKYNLTQDELKVEPKIVSKILFHNVSNLPMWTRVLAPELCRVNFTECFETVDGKSFLVGREENVAASIDVIKFFINRIDDESEKLTYNKLYNGFEGKQDDICFGMAMSIIQRIKKRAEYYRNTKDCFPVIIEKSKSEIMSFVSSKGVSIDENSDLNKKLRITSNALDPMFSKLGFNHAEKEIHVQKWVQ